MRSLGAEVIEHGRDFDEGREWLQQEALSQGVRFIGPTEPELIAGVGTYSLEILEDLPDVDVIVVPIGSGSAAAANCIVAKTVNPKIRVIGVQAEKAPTAQHSWKTGRSVTAPMETSAEGLATRVAFESTQRILRDKVIGLDDFVLVSENALEHAVRQILNHAHTAVETAGAASLAAAINLREQLAGKKVVVVLSGGNITADQMRIILSKG
jgi:threonine dehydratase